MRDFEAVGYRPETRQEALLYELCVVYGYCNDLRASVLAGVNSVDEVVRLVFTCRGPRPRDVR